MGLVLVLFQQKPSPSESQESPPRPAERLPLAQSSTPPPPEPPKPPPPEPPAPPEPPPLLKPAEPVRSLIPPGVERVRVRSVADGDTVTLEDGRKLRYIGLDTPERDQPLHADAKRLNESLVLGRDVYLEFDAEPKDRYGRLLAYVYVRLESGDEKFVNAELLRAGLARIYTFPPNVKHVESFKAAQRGAIEAGRGSWKGYVFNSKPYFVSTPNGRAYHRPNCGDIRNSRDLTRYADAREALNAGKSPCRTCKP